MLRKVLAALNSTSYMSCYQVNITVGGSCEPSWCAYEATDPGILIGVYKPITDYVIPGLAVFTG
jgi:cellulase